MFKPQSIITWTHRKEAFGDHSEVKNEPKMWRTSSPGITSRTSNEDALYFCCDLNTMIIGQLL